MSDSISAEWKGLAPLLEELRSLPAAMQQRLLKGTVATGASVIRQEAIRLAPEWTGETSQGHPPPGTLKRAIYQARLVSECTPAQEVWLVSVRSGKKVQTLKRGKSTVNLDAFYAKWVEYGTSKMPARPFMRPAVETKKQASFDAMQAYLSANLPAAVSAFRFLKAAA